MSAAGRKPCRADGPEATGTPRPGSRLAAAGERDIAAMNARTYAMSPEDRQRWFEEHPLSDFEEGP